MSVETKSNTSISNSTLVIGIIIVSLVFLLFNIDITTVDDVNKVPDIQETNDLSIEVKYDIFNMTSEEYGIIIMDEELEHLNIPSKLLQYLSVITPEERGFIYDGNFNDLTVYFRGIPLPIKTFEPNVWNGAIIKTALSCNFLQDVNSYTLFNQDALEEFLKSVFTSIPYSVGGNELIGILLIKVIKINDDSIAKYKWFDSPTKTTYAIPIYFNELPEYLTDKWLENYIQLKLNTYINSN